MLSDAARKLTVSGLVALIQELVETNFVTVAVAGEISNFAAPASGHWYFTLKDSGAQLRGVMFRGKNRLVESPPRDGMQITCVGTVSVYPARGEMQFVVDRMAVSGRGSLQLAYEALKQKLAAEGLFAQERKRPLPSFPQSVGIVTSASGAAIHDIMNVLRRRAPDVRILLRPVRVQGEGAAAEIAEAIDDLNRYGGLDVLIVGRGGGSLEDLWAFNEESVARAMAQSALPIISAVGHEVDFTIADFVADLRAPTPSAAAELVVKSRLELESHLDHLILRLRQGVQQDLRLAVERVSGLQSRLRLLTRDFRNIPLEVGRFEQRLILAVTGLLQRQTDRLSLVAGRLNTLSPLAQLERGYVIASHEPGGPGLVTSHALNPGDELCLRFAQGRAVTRVEAVEP